MKKYNSKALFLILLLSCLQATGQEVDSITKKLTDYASVINQFFQYLPQEKVYLHFDNTSYYKGDRIWFKSYLATSGLRAETELSKTLYVELLNPGGEIIDKLILKVENGGCHGSFSLNQLPFYSGFYEVRAYTKYMLNFGDELIFSRIIPVFDAPRREGDFTENKMLKYGTGQYPMKREKPQKGKAVNLKFFPEGGNMIQGVASQLAFEATDAWGNPIDVSGVIIDETKKEIANFSVFHEGRGVFSYTPAPGKRKAVVDYEGKKYDFNMPESTPEGYTLQVDNLSHPDSVGFIIQKKKNTAVDMLGMAVLGEGKLRQFCLVEIIDDDIVDFKISKQILPWGVSRAVLFDSRGEIFGDRLFFTHKKKNLEIKAETEKANYAPYESVDMNFTITDVKGNPVQTPFSVSVRDGENEIGYEHNALTDLLLMSEIRGYVRNPSYYFEADDQTHRQALDQLLMVQGWRRYSWKQLTGADPIDIKYLPEQGVEVRGEVVSFVRGKPRSNVDMSFFLTERGGEEDFLAGDEKERNAMINAFTTDSLGRFSIATDTVGKWSMVLSVSEEGKRKNYRILLDRVFSPAARKYRYAELQVTPTEDEELPGEEETAMPEEDIQQILKAYTDSLTRLGLDEKIHHLDEVTIKGKKMTREQEIYENRSKSIVYYDVASELDDIKDRGEVIADDVHELLLHLNKYFIQYPPKDDIYYKMKKALFVVNYERHLGGGVDVIRYRTLRPEAIKSIYINENIGTIARYADPRIPIADLSRTYHCVVFIETYPTALLPTSAGKGVRKTWLEGYSQVEEFYSPDYSVLPQIPDYRRTLYWNPSVSTDENGKANVRFYNNSRCQKFKINAETVTPQGGIGIYKN